MSKNWSQNVETIKRIISEQQPKFLFFPHEDDWHPTHIGVHYLVTDALERMSPDFKCFTVQTTMCKF